MGDLIADGRSLSPYILLPATAIFSVMLILVLSRTASRVTQFVVFAIWLRWILSAFHSFTFTASPLGLSYNALGSLLVIGIGLTVIKSRKLFDVALVPFYIMMVAIVASGALNKDWGGLIDMSVKFGYLAILVLATVDAIREVGPDEFIKLALWPYLIPFGLQALSVALHAGKAAERDGSVSYIGGYQHEAAFSLCLASGLLLVCLSRRLGFFWKFVLIAFCCAGIYLANYRTAILAMGPLVGIVVVAEVTKRFVPAQRGLIAGIMGIVVAAALMVGLTLSGDRFADLGVAIKEGPHLIKPIEDFTVADRRVMSARPFIWSMYILGYSSSKPIQHVVGLGPNSWQSLFRIYAHNTLISYLFELGAFGVAAVLFLWGWMVWLAVRVTDGTRMLLLGGHASFFILNMATMPMWNIEGLIIYALLCGFTVHGYQARQREAAWPVAVDQRTHWAAEAGEIA